MEKTTLKFLSLILKTFKYALILFVALFFLLTLSLIGTYKNFRIAVSNALDGRTNLSLAIEAVKNKNWPEASVQANTAAEKFQ